MPISEKMKSYILTSNKQQVGDGLNEALQKWMKINNPSILKFAEVKFYSGYKTVVAFETQEEYTHVKNSADTFVDITDKVKEGQSYPRWMFGCNDEESLNLCSTLMVPDKKTLKEKNKKQNIEN